VFVTHDVEEAIVLADRICLIDAGRITQVFEIAVTGAVGAGGLGDPATRFGDQRFDKTVMAELVIVLIAIVTLA
jgi:ABC-type methionine transport system permease subunit